MLVCGEGRVGALLVVSSDYVVMVFFRFRLEDCYVCLVSVSEFPCHLFGVGYSVEVFTEVSHGGDFFPAFKTLVRCEWG